MARRRSRRALPLRYRLPNPPAVFQGRDRELARLREAFERAPVAVVAGPGGLGKTSLVLAFLEELGASDAIFVPAERTGHFASSLARALAVANGLEELDWPALMRDADALVALIVDLAEDAESVVVLDDLQRAGEEAVWLLTLLSRYAKKSRFVVTTREPPRIASLVGQVLTLSALDENALREIAWAAAPDVVDAELDTAIARSAGSPLRLLTSLALPVDARGGEGEPLLRGLSEDARSLVDILTLAGIPLPDDVLGRLPSPPSPEVVAEVTRRGLVRRVNDAIELHEVVRGVAEAEGLRPDDATSLGVANALADVGEPSATLAAARLSAFDADRLGALLEREGEALVAAGFGRALWELVGTKPEPRFRRLALSAALEIGDETLLASLSPPSDDASADFRLDWARALRAMGRHAEADEQLRALGDGADPRASFEARRLSALDAMSRDRFTEALEILDALEPVDDEAAAVQGALRAGCLVTLGARDEAAKVVGTLSTRLGSLSAAPRIECRLAIAQTSYALGDLAGARRSIDELLDDIGPSPFAHPRGPWALALRVLVSLDAGELDRAREGLERLAPLTSSASILSSSASVARCGMRLAAGELEGLEESLASAAAEAERLGSVEHACAAGSLSLCLAALRGDTAPRPADWGARPPHPLAHYIFQCRRHCRAARAGDSARETPLPAPPAHPEAEILTHVVESTRALARGDAEAALTAADSALKRAGEAGYRVYAAEARELRADALIALARSEEVVAEAERLRALADAIGSARFGGSARLTSVIGAGLSDLGALEALASDPNASPVAARRARALLGAEPRLDAVDRVVIDAVERAGWVAPTTLDDGGGEWTRGWGIDQPRRCVWLSDGRTVDLSRKRQLLALLVAIARRGGAASKEELVVDVWSEAEYHPLRHDNRLHAAIRKLRREVEDDAKSPTRVCTTESGYAFGEVARVVFDD